MDEMVIKDEGTQAVDGVACTEELITCQRCGEIKPRSDYRQVAHPTICRQCYAAKRRESRQDQVSHVQEDTQGQEKQRVGVYLSPLALATLKALALRYKSDSAAVEGLLLRAHSAMSPEEQAIVSYVQRM